MAKASPEQVHPVKAFGWAANDPSGHLSPFYFSRRATGQEDVRFKVLYCGICHSDLHCIKNEWGFTTYPIIPGHEIVGRVTETGSKVTKVKVGDRVGVGCLVGACHACENCNTDLENHCPKVIQTYNSIDLDGTMTYGGYSDHMVADERYIVRIPENMPLDAGAPLLCAGITVYSPLKYYVGHVAVKFAKAFGARVTVISTSPKKEEEALNRLGADSFLVSSNPDQLQKAQFTLDGIIDTVSAVHPLLPLLGLLKANGKLILVGAPEKPLELPAFSVIMAKHNITADIEVIKAENLNTAMERLAKGDVRYRFVIDVGNTLDATKK
ncbi:Alcohol dehydrogenase 9 [Linum grandiflorum]